MNEKSTITQTIFDLTVIIEEVQYRGRTGYFARCCMPGWTDCANGDTSNEAAAEVLLRMAKVMLLKPALVPTPHNINCKIERADLKDDVNEI